MASSEEPHYGGFSRFELELEVRPLMPVPSLRDVMAPFAPKKTI